MFFLEIARPVFTSDAASITYSFGMRSTDSTAVEFSASRRSFVDMMLDSFGSTLGAMVSGATILGGGNVTNSFSFDQSTGKLDTLNISWPFSAQTMELSAIAVRKVY
jgi:hypothetical protein